jgi:phage FluMu gp28-like protein
VVEEAPNPFEGCDVDGPVIEATESRTNVAIIVRRTEQETSDWLATEEGFMTTFGSFRDEPLQFEGYQLAFLTSPAPFRCVEKSRQTGYSFVFAIEAVARSHLREQHTSVFVSYNLADAKEKIAYCQQLHEELPLEYQKKLVTDSKLELAFEGRTGTRKISRIISNPSKAPRGKTGDIYLDELAHCANDREIYKGSTALILRSHAQLTVCSSPLGRRGIFWEIARQEIRRYPVYWRQSVPWWLCRFFCRDVVLAAAHAPRMSSSERVARFGKKGIRDQFASMSLEDFQQEYEVLYSDEAMTFFPYELIMPCAVADLELAEDISEVVGKIKSTSRLVGGFDVGRRKDLSFFELMEERVDGTFIQRLRKEFDKATFKAQEDYLRAVLVSLPIARLSIDSNGIGMHLAENLAKEFPGVVVEENFSLPNKEIWCNDFKILLQRKQIEFARERQIIAQIHSIKRMVTGAGRVLYEVDRGEDGKGHADDFWAMALACQKERGGRPGSGGTVGARVFG